MQNLVKLVINSFKRQPHKIAKRTETICRLFANCLSVFHHLEGLVLKGLMHGFGCYFYVRDQSTHLVYLDITFDPEYEIQPQFQFLF